MLCLSLFEDSKLYVFEALELCNFLPPHGMETKS